MYCLPSNFSGDCDDCGGEVTTYPSTGLWLDLTSLPDLSPSSTASFMYQAFSKGAQPFNAVGDWSADEWALVNAAWSILVSNTDLVEWAIQFVLGESGECVVDCLNGTFGLLDNKADCWINDGDDLASTATPYSHFTGPIILIGRNSKYFSRAFDAFTCWGVVTDDDLGCAVLDLAASLFHELLHTCYLGNQDTNGCCSSVLICENTFRWTLFTRFINTSNSDACSGYRITGNPCSDWLFFDDEARVMKKFSCVPYDGTVTYAGTAYRDTATEAPMASLRKET